MKKIVALVLSLVMVLGLATVAFGVDAVLYDWNNDTAKWEVSSATIPAGTDLDDLAKGSDDNMLPCYVVAPYTFVEVAEAAATNKLVYGTKTVFLKLVSAEDYSYEAKVSAFTVVDEDDAVCGDYYVADLDEDAVYYASYNKKGELVKVYVADEDGDKNVLVNGKIVTAFEAEPTKMVHDWAGHDVVDHAYTTVKCANCGNIATLYANATAAGKGAEKVVVDGVVLGWITKAAASTTTAPAVDSDKVTSAETFDAGIAMYVGMSVMAAAGSAVVLKKKD